jgi:hypothetical protein
MVKQLRFFLYSICVMAVLASCQGDPGPDGKDGKDGVSGAKGGDGTDGADGNDGSNGGDGNNGNDGAPGADAVAKVGHFSGTITGTRNDGTLINETFNYEYAFGTENMTNEGIFFKRYETVGEAIAGAVAEEAYGIAPPLQDGFAAMDFTEISAARTTVFAFDFFFKKELNNSQIFKLHVSPYLADEDYFGRLLELSPDQNAIYKFDCNPASQINSIYYDRDGDSDNENVLLVSISANNYLNVMYDGITGQLTYLERNDDGVQITDGPEFDKYNAIKLINDPELGTFVFVNASDDSPLWEKINVVPADVVDIQNFQKLNGVISFDFAITVNKYRGTLGKPVGFGVFAIQGENTTHNDLTIAGSFNSGGKVYDEVVGRRRN